ncbi:Mariner Mos1 transposase [Eumeta japonica]|uniref:Mariner Mos1 transposase n=1 Tax=Eumeta variegata TaxID=151549 RepID=A0A4C1ZFR2_EUMVA|nr:Mariner Mos1 transposase [Eumeta japonica]
MCAHNSHDSIEIVNPSPRPTLGLARAPLAVRLYALSPVTPGSAARSHERTAALMLSWGAPAAAGSRVSAKSITSLYTRRSHLNAAHRLLVEAYNEAALNERTRREWFQKLKIGDFDVEDKDRSGRPKIYEDAELEEDSSQAQKELALTLEVTDS